MKSHFLFFWDILGSPLDFFHTPATTPSQPETIAMALSTAAASSRLQTLPPACSILPLTHPPPVAEWMQKRPAPAGWALMSLDRVGGPRTKAGGSSAGVPASPSGESWQERDSGLEPQAAEEGAGEEAAAAADLGVETSPRPDASTGAAGALEENLHRRVRALVTAAENTVGSGFQSHGGLVTPLRSPSLTCPPELLRHLIAQKDELVEEVDALRDMLRVSETSQN